MRGFIRDARLPSFRSNSSYSTQPPMEICWISRASSEERSKYASKASSARMKPQPIFLFSRVTEPRISVPSLPLAELQFCLTFCRHLRLSLRLRFSPSATDALLRPLSQASLPEFDSSRADQRKESENPLRATRTFGRTLVLHRRHESCLSPSFDRHTKSLPPSVPLLLLSHHSTSFLSSPN